MLFPPRIISPWSLTLGHSGMWILQYSWLHVYWVGWEVGCVWGEGEVGWKKRGWGVVWGGGEGGDGGERRDVGELCVCGWRWGERREVFHVILFRGGGGGFQNILEKRHAARGDLSYAFTRGVWGRASPRNFLKWCNLPENFSNPL